MPSPALAPARRRPLRRVAAAALTVTAAVALTGCVGVANQTLAQNDTVGDVTITTDLCTLNSSSSNCGTPWNSSNALAEQLFVAYLVPAAAEAPAHLHGSDVLAGATLSASPDYTDAVVAKRGAAPADMKWVGYSSDELPAVSALSGGQVTADFGAPDGVGSSFATSTVVGYRFVTPSWPIDRPIVCGEAYLSGVGFPPTFTSTSDASCVTGSWPTGAATPTTPTTPTTPPVAGTSPQIVGDTQVLNLNTLTVAAPATTAVDPGATLALSFPVTSSAAGTPVTLPLAATTTVPGASATTAPAITLGADSSETVNVAVPAATAPGDYTVRLSAGSGSGLREATASVHVNAPAAVESTPASSTPTSTPTTTPTSPPSIPTLPETAKALAGQTSTHGAGKALRSHAGLSVTMTVPAGYVRVSITTKDRHVASGQVIGVGSTHLAKSQQITIPLHATAVGAQLLKRFAKDGSPAHVHGIVTVRVNAGSTKTRATAPVTVDVG